MKSKFILGLMALLVCPLLLAADVAINSLPSASAVGASDVVPIVQSGATNKATAAQVATYARSVTTKTDVGLANVENTALSTWAGSTNLTTLGTITTGVWTGTAIAFANGGTGLGSAADDTTLVSSGSAWVAKALPDCTDSGGNHLNYTASTNTYSCGTTNLSGITGLANPTGSLGLTAVNGSATTAMRSDGAPALDITIAPTWTGIHKWSLAEPRLELSESDQGSDLKLWDFDLNGAVLTGRTRTDADGAGVNWLSVTRGTTTAISVISLGNATSNPNFTYLGSGSFTVSGLIQSNSSYRNVSTLPEYRMIESDQGTDLKNWSMQVNNSIWSLQTQTDAGGAGKNIITATRGATTVVASLEYGNTTDNPTHKFDGAATFTNAVISGGTKFTTSGCSVSSTTGGATAGIFTLGANNCTVVVTMAGATGATAPNGWTCQAHDRTGISVVIDGESSSTTTTASIVIPVTAGTTDVISFSCTAF